MSVGSFMANWGSIIIFYIIIIVLVRIFRKKLNIEHKFIVLWKTKFGLKWMDKLGSKWRHKIKLAGYCCIGLGWIGMVFIVVYMFVALIMMFVKPAVEQQVGIALPGLVSIPGVGALPFWHWIIAILIIAIVHEFCHGVVARAFKLKIKNSGFMMWGPILGAFVEPDEKQLNKASDVKQYAVLTAGPISNVVLAGLVLLIINFVMAPIGNALIEPAGVNVQPYLNSSYPMFDAGINQTIIVTEMNGVQILELNDLWNVSRTISPGDEVVLKTENETFNVIAGVQPDNGEDVRGFMGAGALSTYYKVKDSVSKGGYKVFIWFRNLLIWLFVLSFGIGLANLLPLGPVDGGRMLLTYLKGKYPEETAVKIWKRVSIVTLVLLLALIIIPFIL